MTARKAVRRHAPNKSAAASATESTPEASGYGSTLFYLIGERLNSSSKRRAYIPPKQLARALRENPGIPLPPEIHEYLCDFLEGKIRATGGRRTVIENLPAQINAALIPPTYARYFAWLKGRKGLQGWKTIREAVWWQGPPNERAARMTCRYLRLSIDWLRVKNIVSEANKSR